jgi:hypothetical protein
MSEIEDLVQLLSIEIGYGQEVAFHFTEQGEGEG